MPTKGPGKTAYNLHDSAVCGKRCDARDPRERLDVANLDWPLRAYEEKP